MNRWLLLTAIGALTCSPALAQQPTQNGLSAQGETGAAESELQRPESQLDALRRQEPLLDDRPASPQTRVGSSGQADAARQDEQSLRDDAQASQSALPPPDSATGASVGPAGQSSNAGSSVAGPGDLVPPVSSNEFDVSTELGRRAASK